MNRANRKADPKRRGRRATANPLGEENQRLCAENTRRSRRLEQAELIIDVQIKVSALMGFAWSDDRSYGGWVGDIREFASACGADVVGVVTGGCVGVQF